MKIMKTKQGWIVLELNDALDKINIDQMILNNETTTFIYMTEKVADKLYVALGQELLDNSLANLERLPYEKTKETEEKGNY